MVLAETCYVKGDRQAHSPDNTGPLGLSSGKKRNHLSPSSLLVKRQALTLTVVEVFGLASEEKQNYLYLSLFLLVKRQSLSLTVVGLLDSPQRRSKIISIPLFLLVNAAL